jgi:ATP-dependent DNA helicase RecQ
VEQSQPEIEYLQKVYQALANHFQLAIGSSQGESYDFDLDQFSKKFSFKSAAVYPALKKLEEAGLVTFNESFYRPSRVHFSIDKKKIYEFQVAHARFDSILKALLRLYGGELYADFMTISEAQLASALKLSITQVKGELQQLHELQLLAYEPSIDNARITFVLPRQDAERLPIDRVVMEARRNLHLSKMEAIIQYAEQSQRCRMQMIQEYFDEVTYSTCGICDVCIGKRKRLNSTTTKDYESQIIYLLTNGAMSPDDLEAQVAPKDKDLFVEALREAIDAGQVFYDENWLLHLKDSKK